MQLTRSSHSVDRQPSDAHAGAGIHQLLVDALFPRSPRHIAVLTGVVFVFGFAVAILRLGRDLGGPRLWAEDGIVFVYQGATEYSVLAAVGESYAGYLHLAPRLAVEVLRMLPLEAAAAGILVVSALVQALAAALTLRVLVGLGARRWLAVVPAAVVCAVPVGPEVVLNLANLQWFLLYLSFVVLLWQPSTRRGAVLQWLVIMITALSSPFGILAITLSAVRALVLRTRSAVALLVMGAAATAVQLAVMVSGRSIRPEPDPVRSSTWVAAYLRRVVADGLLGIGRLEDSRHSPEVATAVVVLVAFLVLAALAVRRRGAPVFVQIVVLLGLSFVSYLAPMVIAGGTGIDAIFQGRYVVAPALLWLCAVCVAGSAAIGADVLGWLSKVLVVGFTVGALFGMATSYRTQVTGRETNPTWASQAVATAHACASLGTNAVRTFATPPAPPFDFTLTCGQIEGW